MNKLRLLLTSAMMFTVFLVAAGVVTAAVNSGRSAPAVEDLPEDQPTGGATIDELRPHFSVLQSKREARDAPTEAIVQSSLVEDGVADLAEARSVPAADGWASWVAPGESGDTVCQLGPGELNCPLAQTLLDDGASPALYKHEDPRYRLTGIALDEVKAVSVVRADRSTIDIPVVENFFVYRDLKRPLAVRWEGPTGPEEFVFGEYPTAKP